MSNKARVIEQENGAATLAGQWLLFGLLGRLFYLQPRQEELEQIVDEELFADVPFAAANPKTQAGLCQLREWSQAFRADPGARTLDIQADHTRLFVAVERLPVTPWESVYYGEERLLFQESTADVRNWYARYGLEAVSGRSEPEDHIGLELAFIAHLAHQAAAALESGDLERLEELIEAARRFCQQHLLRWAPLWSTQMVEFARTPFYRGLALLLGGALEELAGFLDSPLPEGLAA